MSKMSELHIEEMNDKFDKMCMSCKHWTQDGCEAGKDDFCKVDEKRHGKGWLS